jgi:hypothetical protein
VRHRLQSFPRSEITTHRCEGDAAVVGLATSRAAVTCPRAWSGQYPCGVRLTAFWDRMRAQFGDTYAQSVAKDYVFDKLGGRTIERALADGEDAKVVWRAVCETFSVPDSLR